MEGRAKGGNEKGAFPGEPAHPFLEEVLKGLMKEGLSSQDRRAAWEDLARKGLLEELVRLLERKAQERPEDERINLLLGEGARRMAEEAAGRPDWEDWVEKADRAYERVLGRNPENWEARFGRAALSARSPAGGGRRREGMARLEELIRWQRDKAPRPAFSKTYLLLGRLYAEKGDRDAAQRVWEEGLERFPEDQDLRRLVQR